MATLFEFYLGTPPNTFTPANEALGYRVKTVGDGLGRDVSFWCRVDANLMDSLAHSFDLIDSVRLEPRQDGNCLYYQ